MPPRAGHPLVEGRAHRLERSRPRENINHAKESREGGGVVAARLLLVEGDKGDRPALVVRREVVEERLPRRASAGWGVDTSPLSPAWTASGLLALTILMGRGQAEGGVRLAER